MSDHNDDAGSVVTDRVGGDPAETARDIDARVYRVLGEQFLTRPERERVDAVGVWAGEWRCNAERLPPEFDAALDRIEDGATADAETLRTAYTHLFRGVSERAPDPPYESMYVDGSFYSETTTEIRKGYRWAGFDVDDTHGNEPPDHLGLELQFLGELVAMDDGDRDPDEPDTGDALWWLLDEHLTEWLPAYHARLQREEPHEYYAGLLDLALAVVTSHHKRLAEDR
ncbi:TorD/DmsD family molecular chaperone [Halomicrobium katesii]|uniref:TorD/DmsD family molecular chaperone n=1 Tax=Halomicrobium katesii TaxID=437163 RepID=UPI00037065D7|nr:molecular chaperone TorD family protein [Halomicrobium katesii]